MAGPLPPLRVALAQINSRVGRPRGQRAQDPRVDRARPRRGRRARDLPRARGHRVPAGGPAAQGALPRGRARGDARDRRARPRASSRSSARPSGSRTSTTRSRSWPAAGCRRSTARTGCRTTASSTSSATSRPARGARSSTCRGVRVGLTVCEDIWVPGPPASDEATAGATLIVNAVGVAVPRRQGPPARVDADPARARQPQRVRVLQHRRRPGRARSSTATR